jgi:hypothetical protein
LWESLKSWWESPNPGFLCDEPPFFLVSWARWLGFVVVDIEAAARVQLHLGLVHMDLLQQQLVLMRLGAKVLVKKSDRWNQRIAKDQELTFNGICCAAAHNSFQIGMHCVRP